MSQDPTDTDDTDGLGLQATMGEHSSDDIAAVATASPELGDENDPLVGRVLKGAYRVEKLIGQGGMGAVYRGVQLAVNRQVAIKVLRPVGFMQASAKDALIARFRREAVATSVLNHPNTVRLFDFGEGKDGLLFLVLELLRGQALSDVIRAEGALEPARVASIGYQMCRSLAEAHSNGIVHRDLKPDNVFLCDFEDQADFVKVMDFGIARVVENDSDKGVTQTGATVGTPSYMAPEQAMAAEIHPATDLYSLGIMLYEMLIGRVPFSGDTFMSVALRHLNESPAPLSLPGTPDHVVDGWQTLLDGLLAKVPEERPQSTREVADALKALERISAEARIATMHDAIALPERVRNAGRGPKGKAPKTAGAVSEITMAEQAGIRPPQQKKRGGLFLGLAAAALVTIAVVVYILSQSGDKLPTPSTSVAQQGQPAVNAKPGAPGTKAVIAAGSTPTTTKAMGNTAKPEVGAKKAGGTTGEVPPDTAATAGTTAGAALAKALPKADVADPVVTPQTAKLEFATTPAGATVFRGDSTTPICTTPCDLDVPAGTDEEPLKVVKSGFVTQQVLAKLVVGATVEQTLTLARVARIPSNAGVNKKKKKKKKNAGKTGTKKAGTSVATPAGNGGTKTKKKKKVLIPIFSGSDPTRK